MYSASIDTFWDFQIGIRHATQAEALTYGVVGLEGLAPYLFETQAHLLVSEDNDISAILRQENEFLVTQKLIFRPYVELQFFAQNVAELGVGSGLSNAELGVQTRYEISRAFAPYIDLSYQRSFGKTAQFARSHGDARGAFVATLGVALLF